MLRVKLEVQTGIIPPPRESTTQTIQSHNSLFVAAFTGSNGLSSHTQQTLPVFQNFKITNDIITRITEHNQVTSVRCLSTTTTLCEVRGMRSISTKSALALLYFSDFMVLQMFAAGETGLHIDQHTVYYDAAVIDSCVSASYC